MPTDDEERILTETEDETTETEAPAVDPRDQRIADLEAQLAEATATADALSQALFTANVGSLNMLVNPAEMPYDAGLLTDSDALTAAVLALIEEKPYLAKRRVTGDIDQGPREEGAAPPSLMSTLKAFV